MTNLPSRQLGRTGYEVSRLGYGAWELRGPGKGRELAEGAAEQILNSVLDVGINFIDTSIDYGQAEEMIGRHISHRRSEYFLATKCGCLSGELERNPPDSVKGDRFLTSSRRRRQRPDAESAPNEYGLR